MMVTISIVFFVILISIIAVPVILFYFFSLYKLFEKCGVEGWKGLIPFYNKYIEIRIAGLHWWYIIVYIVSVFLFIDGGTGLKILCALILLGVHSLLSYNLCKKISNGKNNLYINVILLTALPFIYLPVMALNDAFEYDESVEVTPNAYIDEIQTASYKTNPTIKSKRIKKRFCPKCGEVLSPSNIYCPHCGKKL